MKTVHVSVPREECRESQVPAYRSGYHQNSPQHYRTSRSSSGATPLILGGVVGGAIGNALGHSKKNKQVGALVGAVLGATIGQSIVNNDIDRNYYGSGHRSHKKQNHAYSNHTVGYTTEQHFEVVHESYQEERLVGYRVHYEYNNRTYVTRRQTDPGDTIRLRVAVSPAT